MNGPKVYVELCVRLKVVDLFPEIHLGSKLIKSGGSFHRELDKLVVTDPSGDVMFWQSLEHQTIAQAAAVILPAIKRLGGKK